MELITLDEKKYVDIGTVDIWNSVYSTVIIRLEKLENQIPLAIEFLRTGNCRGCDAQETARQINLIRDALSQIAPEKVVYDYKDQSIPAPWGDNISPVITSCGNMFTTADGKDLLFELVAILTYAYVRKTNIVIAE